MEHKFINYLREKYSLDGGNSAAGVDIPSVNVDIKTTSISKPQSSCPYDSARQKIFGLGYSLLVFVYEKFDDGTRQTAHLDIKHTIFVEQARTGDYQMTRGLREILERDGNAEDLIAFMQDRNLPVEEIEAQSIADLLLRQRPEQGYLTISNAFQWRLAFDRAIKQAGVVDGILRVT